MIKQSELEVMVCDLFVDAYRAGQSCGDLAYNSARGTRARLIKELADLYAELEHESYQREQFENELLKATYKIEGLQRDYNHMLEIKDSLLMAYRKLTEDDEEVPDHHDAFDAMFQGCTPDDLPFPDVAVAGPRPATTEASADAEGEAAPASDLLGGDE